MHVNNRGVVLSRQRSWHKIGPDFERTKEGKQRNIGAVKNLIFDRVIAASDPVICTIG